MCVTDGDDGPEAPEQPEYKTDVCCMMEGGYGRAESVFRKAETNGDLDAAVSPEHIRRARRIIFSWQGGFRKVLS